MYPAVLLPRLHWAGGCQAEQVETSSMEANSPVSQLQRQGSPCVPYDALPGVKEAFSQGPAPFSLSDRLLSGSPTALLPAPC